MDIQLRSIFKSFAGKSVLKGLTLEVRSGEILCLLGPSGCGKTTLLRILAGLDQPDQGVVAIDGKDVTKAPPREREIGFVFQSFALYPNKTVDENIAYPLRLKSVSPTDRDKKVRSIAALLGIEELLERYPEKLSGGEAQRVAIARAIVKDPKLYLFDEPLNNVDTIQRTGIREMLRDQLKTRHATGIYVTHDQEEAIAVSDKIAICYDGKILQVGPAKELISAPNSAFVSLFLGKPPINLIEAKWTSSSGEPILILGRELKCDDPTITRRLENSLSLEDGATFLIGVRPYHLRLSGAPRPGEIVIHGTVRSISQYAPLYHIRVDTVLGIIWTVTTEIDRCEGDKVEMFFSIGDCFLFPADNIHVVRDMIRGSLT